MERNREAATDTHEHNINKALPLSANVLLAELYYGVRESDKYVHADASCSLTLGTDRLETKSDLFYISVKDSIETKLRLFAMSHEIFIKKKTLTFFYSVLILV